MRKNKTESSNNIRILILSVLFFTIIPGCISYQYTYNTPSIPQNGDNIILINTGKSASENYQEFGRYLIGRGIFFDSKDERLYTYVTRAKEVSGAYQYKLFIACFDDYIQVSVEQNLLTFGSLDLKWMEWEYSDTAGNLHLDAFKKFFPVLYDYNPNINFKKM